MHLKIKEMLAFTRLMKLCASTASMFVTSVYDQTTCNHLHTFATCPIFQSKEPNMAIVAKFLHNRATPTLHQSSFHRRRCFPSIHDPLFEPGELRRPFSLYLSSYSVDIGLALLAAERHGGRAPWLSWN
jgi:hypothetical protein